MSTKKDKLLESAQKFIQKGQTDRAIKDYEQIVALDPNDLRHRQRLAELLVKANFKPQAISEFSVVAKYYADNSYFLKAIAVYKQIQKLDPANPDISVTLGSLNEKQGLTGNAVAEYGQALAMFEKAGELKKSLHVLERMLALDPQNPSLLLRLAETSFTAGLIDQAYEQFTKLALLVKKQQDEAGLTRLCQRMLTLFPARPDFLLEVLAAQIAMGEAGGAVARLLEIIQQDQTNRRAWYLVLDAYRLTGQDRQLAEACQEMAQLFPDDLSPREQLIQLFVDQGQIEQAIPLLASHAATFIQAGQVELVERWYENLLTLAPIDERILAGLGELYRQAGDQAKHEQTVARLEKLKKLVCPYPATAQLASEGTAELPPPVAPPPLTTPIVDEEEWEEELDLTELEEIDVEPDELTDVSLPEEAVVELELDFEELADEWGEELEGSPPAHTAESFVDFSGELLQEFMNEDRAATAGEPPTAADKYGLAGFFSAFKKGVDAQLDEADTESHYSLGIAYKEMGLYDDAISEFQVASSSPERRLDCLMLQGLCYREKGAPDKALQIFEEALSIPGLGEDELLNIKYELAFSLEAADRPTDACRLYGEIVTVRNDFRDSSDRLQSLAG